MINDNIAPDKQLANGTRCQLHSLNLDDEAWNLVEHAQAGQVIWLPRPPISVNVEIMHTEKMISAGWNSLHTLIPERFVIPLLSSRYPSKFEAVTVKKPRKRNISRSDEILQQAMGFHDMSVELAFAVTVWFEN